MRGLKGNSGIRFHYLVPVRIPAGKTRALICRLFHDYGKWPSAINYVFCSDKYLLKMNREFLRHETLTDIITFDLSDAGSSVVADIFISGDRVRENALGMGVPISAEFLRVIIHGALHLVGFRDKTKAEKAKMRSEEDRYLKLLSAPSVPRITVSHRNKVQRRRG